jgi:dTDP-glucose 4,6-dehydratase
VLARGRVGETYHVGTGVEASVDQIADLVLEELGLPETLKTTVADRPGHDRRYLLDSSKIRSELSWEPQIAFETGVRETIQWYASHRSWWEPLRDRSPVVEDQWAGQAES